MLRGISIFFTFLHCNTIRIKTLSLFKNDTSILTLLVPRYNVQVYVNVYRATYNVALTAVTFFKKIAKFIFLALKQRTNDNFQ